ncbi:MAG: hypothetical protein AAF529_15335 [Pseudomonadota bacterium]
MNDWAQRFLAAHKKGQPYDLLSAEAADPNVQQAYAIQKAYVALRDTPISGYKAALTAPAAQAPMGVDEAITGVLFANGALDNTLPINLTQACLLETEIGFVASQAIDAPITADQAFALCQVCLPMIEVASPNLAGKPSGIDLIATNSASFAYIRGATAETADFDIDDLTVSLSTGQQTLWQTAAGVVRSGQKQALTWLINSVLAQGLQIEPGHIFMTGSIGGMHPAKPGDYTAEFGALGTINFSIAD